MTFEFIFLNPNVLKQVKVNRKTFNYKDDILVFYYLDIINLWLDLYIECVIIIQVVTNVVSSRYLSTHHTITNLSRYFVGTRSNFVNNWGRINYGVSNIKFFRFSKFYFRVVLTQ
jgi:hypothetical protein